MADEQRATTVFDIGARRNVIGGRQGGKLAEEKENRYKQLLEHIFFDRHFGGYKKGQDKIEFAREDLERAAKALRIDLPKNLGDVVYAIRYRTPMPKRIILTQPKGMEWIIEGSWPLPL